MNEENKGMNRRGFLAARDCVVTQAPGLDPARVNPNGSGISLGHPIGATGALITVFERI